MNSNSNFDVLAGNTNACKRSFTLIELLVVIAIRFEIDLLREQNIRYWQKIFRLL